jgi:thiol-disulfide isomerase/thioredoxin
MKIIKLLFCLLLLTVNTKSQQFSFTCFHQKGAYFVANFFNPDKNIYEDMAFANKTAFRKANDTCSVLELKPLAPNFIEIMGDNILVSPDDKTTGIYNYMNSKINITDSASVNFLLSRFTNGLQKMKQSYAVGSSYEVFKTIFTQVKTYFDSSLTVLNTFHFTQKNQHVKLAIIEFYSMQFAHFLVYPIMFNNQYNSVDLKNKIDITVKLQNPYFWFQTQSGRIFLKAYYKKLALPQADFSLEKSFKNKFFVDARIKKYLRYSYFDECMVNPAANSNRQLLLTQFNTFKTSLKFTLEEYKSLDELAMRLNSFNADITQLFCTQNLEDLSGHKLTFEEKKKLIEKGNIIIDYWASWCAPCHEKMGTLKSDKILKGQKQYNIIFISLDKDREKWLASKYSYHSNVNCFRLVDNGENEFVKKFDIGSIPRYFFISNSKLISDKFSY